MTYIEKLQYWWGRIATTRIETKKAGYRRKIVRIEKKQKMLTELKQIDKILKQTK